MNKLNFLLSKFLSPLLGFEEWSLPIPQVSPWVINSNTLAPGKLYGFVTLTK